MDPAKFLEETTTDCETGLAVRRIVIPADSLAPHVRAGLFDASILLGMTTLATLTSADEAIRVLSSMLGLSETATALAELVVEEAVVGLPSISLASLANEKALQVTQFATEPLMLGVCEQAVIVSGLAESVSKALTLSLSSRLRDIMGLDGRNHQSTGPAAVRC